MKPLAPDERFVTTILYTSNMLARGDFVAKENSRVSILLRTQGVPNYIHLIKPQVVLFGGTPPKPLAYSEIFIPTPQVLGFHIAPPEHDVMDYDPTEQNRIMQPVDVLIGLFLAKAKIRISSQTDVATSLDVARSPWLSIYDAEITNPYLPQFKIQVPMLLVSSTAVSFNLV